MDVAAPVGQTLLHVLFGKSLRWRFEDFFLPLTEVFTASIGHCV